MGWGQLRQLVEEEAGEGRQLQGVEEELQPPEQALQLQELHLRRPASS